MNPALRQIFLEREKEDKLLEEYRKKTCIFVNKNGVACPRKAWSYICGSAPKTPVCRRHACWICYEVTDKEHFCQNHTYSDYIKQQRRQFGQSEDEIECKYISGDGKKCSTKTFDEYCDMHRCKHGQKCSRSGYWCKNKITSDKIEYCEEHIDTCHCIEIVDGDNFGDTEKVVCHMKMIMNNPYNMCEFHYKTYLCEKDEF